MNRLKFNDDGTFTILQFTDVHWVDGSEKDQKTKKVIETVLKYENPDLIIFTGDMVYSESNADAMKQVVEIVNRTKKPWASVFGNHDSQLGNDRETLLKIQQESQTCLTQAGDKELSGVGNYSLKVYNKSGSRTSWVLYFLDSGVTYNKNKTVGGYDFIKRDQINWYVKQSAAVKNACGTIPALMFFHMPLPEYNEVWENCTCYGEKNEGVCSPKQNSGMFSAMLEMGDVKGVFVGHDHINDYWGELYGIKLCYGRAAGYNTYGRDDFLKGARLIKLKENQTGFETWVRLEDGYVINSPVKHEPEKQAKDK